MTDLVFKGQNDQVLTNSLLVAEKFGKEHSKVMRDIENLSFPMNLEPPILACPLILVYKTRSYPCM